VNKSSCYPSEQVDFLPDFAVDDAEIKKYLQAVSLQK
jgi:hypothetical protein